MRFLDLIKIKCLFHTLQKKIKSFYCQLKHIYVTKFEIDQESKKPKLILFIIRPRLVRILLTSFAVPIRYLKKRIDGS